MRTIDTADVSPDERQVWTGDHLYPNLPVTGTAHSKPLRICIVSHECAGPNQNNGLGMAYATLADTLAAAGHQVTFLYTSREEMPLQQWIDYYETKGIRFIPLPPQKDSGDTAAEWIRHPYEIYQWLKKREFDVIHCPEYLGNAYHIARAKAQGFAFAKTLLCVEVHGPSMWSREINQFQVTELRHRGVDFLERQSAALADVLISPSQYMLQWVTDQGWNLPDQVYVQQNIQPPRRSKPPALDRFSNLEEIVFFGRIEPRKGYELFCDAIEILPKELIQKITVTFLGHPMELYTGDSGEEVKLRAERWPCKWKILPDKSQEEALAYMSENPCLAIMPSYGENSPYVVLECLSAGIPFLASRVGGIPELIAVEDQPSACFFPVQATTLAERMEHALRYGILPAAPAVDFQANRQNWLAWHNHLTIVATKGKHPDNTPVPDEFKHIPLITNPFLLAR